MRCSCRYCGGQYEEERSRADYKGYCSQTCMKEKAKALGWDGKERKLNLRKPLIADLEGSLYNILHNAKEIGNLPVVP